MPGPGNSGIPNEGLDPASLEAARALIGVPLRRPPHNCLASRLAINRWAKSIGDRNPLWLDPGYAGHGGQGRVIAPPCWLYSVDDTCIAPKLPGLHQIYGGAQWEFYRWVRLGDRVRSESRLVDIQEKSGRFCGPMVLQTGETVFTGDTGEAVAKATSWVLRTPRAPAIDAGKYREWRKQPLTAPEALAIEDAYDAEQIRGGQPRYWESVKESVPLPPIVRGPLTSEEMIQFINATRPSLGFKAFLRYRQRHPGFAFLDPDIGSWESWEASMLRDDVAGMFGFPYAHDSGIDRISWVGNLLTNWMGDSGFLRSLSVTLTLPNVYGDVTWCRGAVTRVYREEDRRLAEVALWCENQRAQQTAVGRATVALPSQAAG